MEPKTAEEVHIAALHSTLHTDRNGFPLLSVNRLTVPGGWIFTLTARSLQGAVAVSTEFVPFPPESVPDLPTLRADLDPISER